MESKKAAIKRQSKVTWTRELTLKLIDQYESHSNLWDVTSKDYKNRHLRSASIDAISKVMGISVQEINDKIHNLRCQFQIINGKRYKTKSGQAAGDNFVVRWEFYHALKFINVPGHCNNETIDSLVRF